MNCYDSSKPLKYMPDNKKQSLLIIESDDAILKNLTERFKKRGMLVITAKDGYEGYTRVRAMSRLILSLWRYFYQV